MGENSKTTNTIFLLQTVPLDEEEWDSTTYDTTPVMSSYLLAMVVCDFTFKEAGTEGPDRIQVRPKCNA